MNIDFVKDDSKKKDVKTSNIITLTSDVVLINENLNEIKKKYEIYDDLQNKILQKLQNLIKIAKKNKEWKKILQKNYSLKKVVLNSKEFLIDNFFKKYIDYFISMIKKGILNLCNFYDIILKKLKNLKSQFDSILKIQTALSILPKAIIFDDLLFKKL